ncbi:cytochrome P450 [Streptomyces diastatochromogenes]|uniref:cytochrome P450 n=1 Tax=Streptomyces diastatochromogenes TaxID=42236 RepID=UPI0036597069
MFSSSRVNHAITDIAGWFCFGVIVVGILLLIFWGGSACFSAWRAQRLWKDPDYHRRVVNQRMFRFRDDVSRGLVRGSAPFSVGLVALPDGDADVHRRRRRPAPARGPLHGTRRSRTAVRPALTRRQKQTVLVTGPQAVQHVLARHLERYVKRSHRARLLIGDGVLAATGTAWKRQRRLLQAQFTGTGMRRYEGRITAAARTTAGRWTGYAHTGQTFDVGHEMRRFALDAIRRSLTRHPFDDATEREPAAVAAALPTLPADHTDAQKAVAADLARIDAVARHAAEAARSGDTGPDGPVCCTSCSTPPPSTPSTPTG